mmetsp:Transcript_6994/g.11294  ORF Transcript_6994/g.11294 Transcript_6994/m.11294 type:complete len:278 (+) Transcript_6994:98-931(+)
MVRGLVANGLVVEIDVHVGQDGLFGVGLFNPVKRVGQVAVRRMRIAAQGVDDPAVQILELFPRRCRDLSHIGQISHMANPEPKRVDAAMTHLERFKCDGPASTVDHRVAVDGVEVEDRRVGRAFRLHEDISEPAEQRVLGGAIRPDLQPGAHVEDHHTQIIDPVNMVGVGMGIDHPVKPSDALIQQLVAQVRRGVDQDARFAARTCALHQKGTALPPVLGIARIAIPPMSAQSRHPTRGAAAQDREGQRVSHGTTVYPAALENKRSKFFWVCAANSA